MGQTVVKLSRLLRYVSMGKDSFILPALDENLALFEKKTHVDYLCWNPPYSDIAPLYRKCTIVMFSRYILCQEENCDFGQNILYTFNVPRDEESETFYDEQYFRKQELRELKLLQKQEQKQFQVCVSRILCNQFCVFP